MTAMNPRRRRRRREEPRPITYLVLGVATVAILVIVAVVSLRAISDGVPTARNQVYFAAVRDAGSLRAHDEVRIGGRRAGQVGEVEMVPGGARVQMKLDHDMEALPKDSRVAIRPRGLLGVRYVDLVLGKSRETISPGGTIRSTADNLAYGIPEVLDTLDAKTRSAARGAIGGLGGGFSGRGGDLNRTIETLPKGARDLKALSEAILGRPGSAGRLFPSLASGSAAFDAAREPFVDALKPTDEAVRPLIDRRESFNDVIEDAPGALSSANIGFASGRQLLAAARSLSEAASDGLPPAPAGLRATTELLRTSHVPLRRTADLLPRLDAAVPATLDVTKNLDPVLDPLKRGTEHAKRPVVTLGRYSCDIKNMLANWRSTAGQAVKGGNATGIGPLTTFRLNVIAGLGATTPLTGRPTDDVAYVDRKTYSEACAHPPSDYGVTDIPVPSYRKATR